VLPNSGSIAVGYPLSDELSRAAERTEYRIKSGTTGMASSGKLEANCGFVDRRYTLAALKLFSNRVSQKVPDATLLDIVNTCVPSLSKKASKRSMNSFIDCF
jgi:hypothetical protein